MIIGTIVASSSHTSYLCRVFGKLETDDVPHAGEYAFGAFVSVVPFEGSAIELVGIISNTMLVNPDFGNHGPRLSSAEEREVFSPDYLNEKGIVVEILVLGWSEAGRSHHTVPAPAAQPGSRVDRMEHGAVADFHRDGRNRFVAGYLPPLLSRNDPMISSLLLSVLERLEPVFPDQSQVIAVLRNNLAWKARIVPAG
jgi:hypothetical protein